MDGYIKIESATQNGRVGLCVEGCMRGVNLMDKFHVLHCVCRVLHIDSKDLVIFEELEKIDIWDEETVEEGEEEEEKVRGVLDKIFGGHHEG